MESTSSTKQKHASMCDEEKYIYNENYSSSSTTMQSSLLQHTRVRRPLLDLTNCAVNLSQIFDSHQIGFDKIDGCNIDFRSCYQDNEHTQIEYYDIGDATCVYAFCGAKLWLEDQPDITFIVFKIKLGHLMNDLKNGFFERVIATFYTIEFQKRGLPHAHILLFLHPEDKCPTPQDIDRIICVEIPNKDSNSILHSMVGNFMIHGPSEQLNLRSQCMKDGRKRGFSLGRLYNVPPSSGELYYERILLNKIKGLLDDDKEFIEAIAKASTWGSSSYLRKLFVIMLLSNTLSRPNFVWDKTWKLLYEDILFQHQRELQITGLHLSDDQLKNDALYEIEKQLRTNCKSLKYYPRMPILEENIVSNMQNKLIMDKLNYDKAVTS
ncbi:ATP-dependent DNA helicase PIF1 [Senna tora]|uniref:ATP-dependent DNA helicase PIF1 n=1 Tax=Senna tora TaxID=362788 RepID=A0A834XEE1_9FABA|nr:ATP-dependent DNA helicase PIF1 [Senna tora]